MANVKNLRSGFTGELPDKDSVTEKAKEAAGYIRDEAGAVTRHAKDHPSSTGALVLLIGATAFLAGYLCGSSSTPPPSRRFW